MAFTLSFDLTNLGDLNTFLQSRSYVVGFTATATDVALFNALGKAPDAGKFPNVFRFYQHMASLSADAKAKLPAGISGVSVGGAVVAAPKAAAKPAAAEEEDVDLFGDDDDAAAKVKVEKPKEVEKKKEKKQVVQKTICVYKVSPLEAETPLEEIEAAIRSIQMDGLAWGQTFKREPVGYGIFNLIVQCVVEDEKVSLDELEEKIMAFEDLVQSFDQLSMNKIT